jgi:hypothetical protein
MQALPEATALVFAMNVPTAVEPWRRDQVTRSEDAGTGNRSGRRLPIHAGHVWPPAKTSAYFCRLRVTLTSITP